MEYGRRADQIRAVPVIAQVILPLSSYATAFRPAGSSGTTWQPLALTSRPVLVKIISSVSAPATTVCAAVISASSGLTIVTAKLTVAAVASVPTTLAAAMVYSVLVATTAGTPVIWQVAESPCTTGERRSPVGRVGLLAAVSIVQPLARTSPPVLAKMIGAMGRPARNTPPLKLVGVAESVKSILARSGAVPGSGGSGVTASGT